MYHAGVVKALFESNLLPRIISGASVGSIICAIVGTCILAHLWGPFFKAQHPRYDSNGGDGNVILCRHSHR